MATYEVPTSPKPQTVNVQFPNGNFYQLRLTYVFTPDDCWLLDINDAFGNPIVCGIPLLAGVSLLKQYAYLNFGCVLYCVVDGEPNANPKFYNLGTTAHLYLEA